MSIQDFVFPCLNRRLGWRLEVLYAVEVCRIQKNIDTVEAYGVTTSQEISNSCVCW